VLDLTERKRAEQDLREREAKIRRLVDGNIIGVFVADLDGHIMEANDEFLRIVGYEREHLTAGGINVLDMTPPEWRDRTRHTQMEIRLGKTVQPYEKEYLRRDGSRVPVLVGSTLFQEGGFGSQLGVVFVVELTELKRAEAEVRESEQRAREMQMELAHANRVATIGQLTASVAHEVNQPIAAVRTSAGAALRFLSRDPPDLEEVGEALGSIVEDTTRAGDIVHRIRALVKKEPLQNTRFNMNDAINELIALAQSEVLEKGVTVRLSLAEGLSPVRGDRVQLQQVVLNLILNAVQAMSLVGDAPRELSISTEPTGAHDVLVAVRDSGPGIDPEHRERVFDSFYTTKPSGMGLGLSICRSIVDAHGGKLWAGTNQPKGAVFQFTLPATNEDHELPRGLPASTAFETQPARSLASETTDNLRSFLAGGAMLEADPIVLAIDDDPAVRQSLGRLLRSVGLDAQLFASVTDLLKSEAPRGPTCMVIDVQMPERSGLDFQRELAAADVQIPIIFMSAHGDVPISVQAMKRGAIEFLTKPWRDDDLIEAIRLGLARDRARRENEKALSALRASFESLSPREREVMIHVVQGRLSKQIAHDIGTSEAAVNFHRSNLMRKMNVRSLPELCRMADKLKLSSEMT
jgi:PAS domain S-box-containing protein